MSDYYEVNALLYEKQIELLKIELDNNPDSSLVEKINERIQFLHTRADFFRKAGIEFRKRFYG